MKLKLAFLLFFIPMLAHAEDEIATQYTSLKKLAASSCSGIQNGLSKISSAVGIGTGAGIVGTLSGGVALTTGIIKTGVDKKIASEQQQSASLKNLIDMPDDEFTKMMDNNPATINDALKKALSGTTTDDSDKKAALVAQKETVDAELTKDQGKAKGLGTARTVGNFVSGGANVVGAITSFVSLKEFDDVEKQMRDCNVVIKQISTLQERAKFETPDDKATLDSMAKIIDNCKGMDPKNISNIRGKLTASGVISSVGGVLGITGGITSAIAGSKESKGASAVTNADGGTKTLNTVSNIAAGGATISGLAGTILNGTMLSGLRDNNDIATKCASSF